MPFEDLRQYLSHLEKEGEVAFVKEQVDYRNELAAIVRKTWDLYGDASPAILFENIKGYAPPGPNKVLVPGLGRYQRLALLLGLDDISHPREIIREWRKKARNLVKPRMVPHGPCKDNKDFGDKVNLFKFPVPLWHHRDGGRYIGTHCQVVTRDPDSGWVNVGTYRLQVLDESTLGILLHPGRQHIGLHFGKYIERGKAMPVSVAIGGPPICDVVAMSAFTANICEYEVAGGLQSSPVELVRSEMSDLPVPATAEIVIEGTIDPVQRKEEGPFGEYPGYYGEVPAPRPFIKVNCVTYREDPILNGTLCSYPFSDQTSLSVIAYGAYAWDMLELAGVPGVVDVAPSASSTSGHIVVAIKPLVRGQATAIASTLWGAHRAHWSYKQVVVVDEDIDPWDLEQVDWAIWTRVKASEDIHIWPRTKGGNLDPRVPPEEKGLWDRALIDASRPLHWEPRAMWAREGVNKGEPLRFPPVARPDPETMERINARWDRYDIKPVERYIGKGKGLFAHWWSPEFIEGIKCKRITP